MNHLKSFLPVSSTQALLLLLLIFSSKVLAVQKWSLDFGAGNGPSAKSGLAATGQGPNDFWNYYTRDGSGGWLYYGTVDNMKTVDGAASDVDVTVANAPGAWGLSSSDAMYDGYIYPWYGESATLTVKTLPVGSYDIYIYSPDAAFQLTVGATSYGTKNCYEASVANPPVWEEGKQLVRYASVQITSAGQDVVITINPGVGGYATFSGLQITPACDINFTTHPSGQTTTVGTTVALSGQAMGSGTITYQWLVNGNPVSGATQPTLSLANVQPWNSGAYTLRAQNSTGQRFSSPAIVSVYNQTIANLWNVDFGSGSNPSAKTGPADLGKALNDFWNFYTRDDGQGGGRDFGTLDDIVRADGTASAVDIEVENLPRAISVQSSDPMYNEQIASMDQWDYDTVCTVKIKNLPVGVYDLYMYSPDSELEISSPTFWDWQYTSDFPVINPPQWQPSQHYARSGPIQVLSTSQEIVVRVLPGWNNGYATISGLQIMETKQTWSIDLGAGPGPSAEKGFAAGGQASSDFWNYYTRDSVNSSAENLKTVTGNETSVGIIVNNAPGAWSCVSSDPMYDGYIYPWQGQSGSLSVKNLPTGTYDLYLYAPDASFQVSVGATSYGTRTAWESPVVNPPVWLEGKQYARYSGVQIPAAGGDINIQFNPGVSGYATCSGLQVVQTASTDILFYYATQSQGLNVGASISLAAYAYSLSNPTLTYQWFFNGAPLVGQTQYTLNLSSVQFADSGVYVLRAQNSTGTAMSAPIKLTVYQKTKKNTWNVDFGAGVGPSQKVGPAVVGKVLTDFWNFYTRDDGNGGWLDHGELNDLLRTDGVASSVDITVDNAPGAWGSGSLDPMYNDYLYPFESTGLVTIKNMPVGVYDLYVYSPDAAFEVTSGGVNYGNKSCQDVSFSNPPIWTEGEQYVKYIGINITQPNQDVVLSVLPGQSGYATISGFQITEQLKPSLRKAVYDHFTATTSGKSINLWNTRTMPQGYPTVPPVLAWDPNSLIFGLNNFTAISQNWQGEGAPGQVPITAISRRHGYSRGHGWGADGQLVIGDGRKVWFCTANNTLIEVAVAGYMTRIGNGRDFTVFIFDQDLPASITPMSAMSQQTFADKYVDTVDPTVPAVSYLTCQHGLVSATVPPFNTHNTWVGGDSGSPNMIPMPDGTLVMYGGRSTTGPSVDMQAAMDALSAALGLNPASYQLNWYDFSPWD
jgi:hypothetical protein